jgi:hypothetical protein
MVVRCTSRYPALGSSLVAFFCGRMDFSRDRRPRLHRRRDFFPGGIALLPCRAAVGDGRAHPIGTDTWLRAKLHLPLGRCPKPGRRCDAIVGGAARRTARTASAAVAPPVARPEKVIRWSHAKHPPWSPGPQVARLRGDGLLEGSSRAVGTLSLGAHAVNQRQMAPLHARVWTSLVDHAQIVRLIVSDDSPRGQRCKLATWQMLAPLVFRSRAIIREGARCPMQTAHNRMRASASG